MPRRRAARSARDPRCANPGRAVCGRACISSPAREARSCCSRNKGTVSSACVIAQRRKRFKTVELIVSGRDWDPPAPRFADDAPVAVRVDFAEGELRQRVKQAGGTWNPDRKVWELRYADVVALTLETRIVNTRASDTRCPR